MNQPTLMSTLITKAVLEVEGQTIPIPMNYATDDDILRRTLVPMFPGAAGARFERKEEGDTLKVRVIKQLQSKGGWDELIEAKPGENSAVVMYRKLKKEEGSLTAEQLLMREKQIREAIEDGKEEVNKMEVAIGRLSAAPPEPSPFIPLGF